MTRIPLIPYILRYRTLDPNQKLLLIAIEYAADENYKASLSLADLCDLTSLSKKTVKKLISQMNELFIYQKPMYTKNGARLKSVYYINPELIPILSDYSREEPTPVPEGEIPF